MCKGPLIELLTEKRLLQNIAHKIDLYKKCALIYIEILISFQFLMYGTISINLILFERNIQIGAKSWMAKEKVKLIIGIRLLLLLF